MPYIVLSTADTLTEIAACLCQDIVVSCIALKGHELLFVYCMSYCFAKT